MRGHSIVQKGRGAAAACAVSLIHPITDDPEMQKVLEEIVESILCREEGR
ncbi:MAG: CbbQ/NirQ/NorQ C-terminal domain-containing protein [Thermodesulfovibrionales bacterium]